MTPVDQSVYDASHFDRPKLDRYAARVAKETRRPLQTTWAQGHATALGPHWVIFDFEWNERHNYVSQGRPRIETDEFTYEHTRLALTEQGKILRAYRRDVNIENTIGPGMEFHSQPGEESLVRATDGDLLALDYTTKPVRWEAGKHIKWGNRPGPALIRHAKGVGISMALKQLLET